MKICGRNSPWCPECNFRKLLGPVAFLPWGTNCSVFCSWTTPYQMLWSNCRKQKTYVKTFTIEVTTTNMMNVQDLFLIYKSAQLNTHTAALTLWVYPVIFSSTSPKKGRKLKKNAKSPWGCHVHWVIVIKMWGPFCTDVSSNSWNLDLWLKQQQQPRRVHRTYPLPTNPHRPVLMHRR